MDYNYMLFQTEQFENRTNRFHLVYSGAFYDAYTEDGKKFYMPMECKESLLSRISFYRKYIVNHPYPVFDEFGDDDVIESEKCPGKVLKQVLGLPDVLMENQKTGEVLPPDEIISSITFLDDIKIDLRKPEKEDISLLLSADDSLIWAMNDLVKNGFYVPEISMVATSVRLDKTFPCYLDSSLIPVKYLKEKETAEKLLMDFVMNPLQISSADFLHYFKPLDEMTLEEKFRIAFDEDDPENEALWIRQKALQDYFGALMKQIVNDFYRKHFSIHHLCGFSPLDHDFGFYSFVYPYFSIGSCFDMVAVDYIKPVLKENGDYDAVIDLSDYAIYKKDISRIRHRFDLVKTYLEKAQESDVRYDFMPATFLKLLGLPYPSYRYARFFDFRSGDVDDFLSLFKVVDMPRLIDAGIKRIDVFSSLMDEENEDCYPCNMDSLFERNGIELCPDYASLTCFEENGPFLLSHRANLKGDIQKVMDGNLNVLKDMVDFEELKDDPRAEYLLGHVIGNTCVLMKRVFDSLSQGMDSRMAMKELGPDCPEGFDYFCLKVLFEAVSNHAPDKKKEQQDPQILMDLISRNYTLYIPGLEYPYVHFGRFFLAYSKDSKGQDIVFDEDEMEAIDAIEKEAKKPIRKIHAGCYEFGEMNVFDYVPDRNQKKENLVSIAGLPGLIRQMTLNRSVSKVIPFRKDVSILNKRFYPLIDKVPYLTSIFSYHMSNLPFFLKKKPIPENLYLHYCGPVYHFYDYMETALKDDEVEIFRPVDGYVLDEDGSFPLLIDYEKALVSEAGFHPNDEFSLLNLFHDEKKNLDVAVGRNFYAFGDRNNPDSFYIRKEDKGDLKRIFERCYPLAEALDDDLGTGEYQCTALMYLLGVPLVFQKRLQNKYRAGGVSFEDFEEIFGFDKSVPLTLKEMKEYPSYLNMYRHRRIPLGGEIDSNPLRYEARKQGLYIFGGGGLFFDEKFNPDEFISNPEMMADRERRVGVYIDFDRISGEARSLLLPNDTIFHNEVSSFINLIQKHYDPDSSILFEFRKMMHVFHSKRDATLMKIFFNAMSQYPSCFSALAEEYVQHNAIDSTLNEDSTELTILLEAFLWYALELTYYRISQSIAYQE